MVLKLYTSKAKGDLHNYFHNYEKCYVYNIFIIFSQQILSGRLLWMDKKVI